MSVDADFKKDSSKRLDVKKNDDRGAQDWLKTALVVGMQQTIIPAVISAILR